MTTSREKEQLCLSERSMPGTTQRAEQESESAGMVKQTSIINNQLATMRDNLGSLLSPSP
jgi:hypothetical protein